MVAANRKARHDFEIIDRTHLIVYAGAQRCAFHIELQGTFCDLTFAPELYFSRLGEMQATQTGTVPTDPRAPVSIDPFGPTRARPDLRICANDLNVQVHGGAFTESPSTNPPPDRFGNARAECRISAVESMTDDQLVELYVARGVIPPLPPMGAGEIEVGEQEEPDEREAAPAEADGEQKGGRRRR